MIHTAHAAHVAAPLAHTFAGDVVIYVLCPLLVITIVGMIGWASRINSRLSTQDKALALLVQDIAPAGKPSLRDIVNEHDVKFARIEGQLANPAPPTIHIEGH